MATTRKNTSLQELLDVVLNKEIRDTKEACEKLSLTAQSFHQRLNAARSANVILFVGLNEQLQRFKTKQRLSEQDIMRKMAKSLGQTPEEFIKNRDMEIERQAKEEGVTTEVILERIADQQTENNKAQQVRKAKLRDTAKSDKPAGKRGRPKNKETVTA